MRTLRYICHLPFTFCHLNWFSEGENRFIPGEEQRIPTATREELHLAVGLSLIGLEA
jgi:hypothetical protein